MWTAGVHMALTSVYLVTRAVLPHMLKQGSGSITNVASVDGMIGLGEEPYAASKAGIINLAQNLAARYGKHGIRASTWLRGPFRHADSLNFRFCCAWHNHNASLGPADCVCARHPHQASPALSYRPIRNG